MIDFKAQYRELRDKVISELGAVAEICHESQCEIPAMLVPYKGGVNHGKDVMIDGEMPDWLAVYQSVQEDAEIQRLITAAYEDAEKMIIRGARQMNTENLEIFSLETLDYMGIPVQYNQFQYNLARIEIDFHPRFKGIVIGGEYTDDFETYIECNVRLTSEHICIADLLRLVDAMKRYFQENKM